MKIAGSKQPKANGKGLDQRSFYRERVNRLKSRLVEKELDAILLSHLPNIRYLTGFSGSSALLIISSRSAHFISDGRYDEQARVEVAGASIHISGAHSLLEEIRLRKLLRGASRIGFEEEHLFVSTHRLLRATFPKARFVPLKQIGDQLRRVKSVEEIDLIQAAARITDLVFQDLLRMIKPGVAELDIAAEISYRHRKYGAEGDAFEPIVLAGRRTSLIHGRPGNAKVKKGDPVLIDMGCFFNGYCCDMTRTLFAGRPSGEMKKIHQAVLAAQRSAIGMLRAGAASREVDRRARESIADAGYGRYFTHSTGHGIGLEIHEQPRLSLLSRDVLAPNEVVTVEPGIYIPGTGGVRIEDDLVVLEDSCMPLNNSSRELLVL